MSVRKKISLFGLRAVLGSLLAKNRYPPLWSRRGAVKARKERPPPAGLTVTSDLTAALAATHVAYTLHMRASALLLASLAAALAAVAFTGVCSLLRARYVYSGLAITWPAAALVGLLFRFCAQIVRSHQETAAVPRGRCSGAGSVGTGKDTELDWHEAAPEHRINAVPSMDEVMRGPGSESAEPAKEDAEGGGAREEQRDARRVVRKVKMGGPKPCDVCARDVDLLVVVRCQADASNQQWRMVCGRCWKAVAKQNPHYRYGGLWRRAR